MKFAKMTIDGSLYEKKRETNKFTHWTGTLESLIDVGQGISVGPGRFGKNNKRRALNTLVLCSKYPSK